MKLVAQAEGLAEEPVTLEIMLEPHLLERMLAGMPVIVIAKARRVKEKDQRSELALAE